MRDQREQMPRNPTQFTVSNWGTVLFIGGLTLFAVSIVMALLAIWTSDPFFQKRFDGSAWIFFGVSCVSMVVGGVMRWGVE